MYFENLNPLRAPSVVFFPLVCQCSCELFPSLRILQGIPSRKMAFEQTSMKLLIRDLLPLTSLRFLLPEMFQDLLVKIFIFHHILNNEMLSNSWWYISAINFLLVEKKSEYFQFLSLKALWYCLMLLLSGDFCDQLLPWMPFYTAISLVSPIHLSEPLWLYV